MKIISKLFEFVMFVQMTLFLVFIVENYNSLDEIKIVYETNVDVIGNVDITLNFYEFMTFVGILGMIIVISGGVIAATGLSDVSVSAFAKILVGITLFAMMTVGSATYILLLGTFGVIIQFILSLIWGLKILDNLTGNQGVDS